MRRWRHITLHRWRGSTWQLTCERCNRIIYGTEQQALRRLGEHTCEEDT